MGFRGLAPLYNEDNALGGGARGDAARGLTDLGRQVVERAWRLGFLVDIAHSNHRTQRDLIDLALAAGRPVHFSHGFLDEPVLELFGQRGLLRRQAVTFPAFASVATIPDFAGRLAEAHGEEFARNFCGRSLRRMLERSLPKA